MKGMLYTADHHVYELPPLLEWNMRHTGTVPCDSWSVTAVYRPEMAPVLKMAAGFAAVEDGQTQLRGIVDEYSVELDQNGLTVTLAGRGYAARLLDNESRPVTYERVTLRELLRRHAEPYGITVGEAVELSSAAPYTARGRQQPMEGHFGVLPGLRWLSTPVFQDGRAVGSTGAGGAAVGAG